MWPRTGFRFPEDRHWPMQLMSSLLAGANVVMSMTSLTSALSAIRWGRAAEPCVWVSNPFGISVTASVAWNSALAVSLGMTGILWLAPRGNCISSRTSFRWILAFFLLAFSGQSLNDSVVFAKLVSNAHITSSFPLPLTAAVLCVLLCNLTLLTPSPKTLQSLDATDSIEDGQLRVPDRRATLAQFAHFALLMSGMCVGQLLMILMHVLTFGATDYRRDADIAVVLGARVYSNGTLSLALSDRLQTAVDLFESKQVQSLLVSGATGVEGINEAHAMRKFLITAGIPEDRILVDDQGVNTLATARNVRRIMSEQHLNSALIVSHYFHLARCKLLFKEQGINSVTVPARMSRRLVFEPYFVMRECAGYLWYALTHPLRSSP